MSRTRSRRTVAHVAPAYAHQSEAMSEPVSGRKLHFALSPPCALWPPRHGPPAEVRTA